MIGVLVGHVKTQLSIPTMQQVKEAGSLRSGSVAPVPASGTEAGDSSCCGG
jgi:hypothetical protein